MKLCKECDGEGVAIIGGPCPVCLGMGVINVPTHIYLQLEAIDYDDEKYPSLVTWSDERINDNDLEYVLVPPDQCTAPEAWQ